MTREIQTGPRKIYKGNDEDDVNLGPSVAGDSSFSNLMDLSITDFTNTVKNFTPKEAKSLVSYLIKQRNEKYVALDTERDKLNKYVEKADNKEKARDVAGEKIKDLRAKYMSEIRDIRSKITVARKYA